MLKYAKVINEKTKQCDVGIGTNTAYYVSLGMSEMDVEQSCNGSWYLVGYVPELTKEEIRIMRQERYVVEADPIRYDYDEALARGEETSEALKQEWLAKKDEIRADLPYPEEND